MEARTRVASSYEYDQERERETLAVTLLNLVKNFPDLPTSTRCRVLRMCGKCGKPEVCRALNDVRKKKRLDCKKLYMRIVERLSMNPMGEVEDGTKWGTTSSPDPAPGRRWWC